MRLPGADTYRKTRYDKTPGWFWPEDFDIFDRILAQQLNDNIRGDLLEIGCYHGKSAILMGCGLRADDTLAICDLFGGDAEETAEATDHFEAGFGEKTFTANYAKSHQRPAEIHACSSLDLTFDYERFRFIHVDGGHGQQVATHDIVLALKASKPLGVIAIDDYRTHHTPGVPAAIWSLAALGEIATGLTGVLTTENVLYPFALSETKVYAAATRAGQQHWLGVARSWGFTGNEEHQIFGSTVLRTTRGRNAWN